MTATPVKPQGLRPSLGDISTVATDDDAIDIGRIITNPNWQRSGGMPLRGWSSLRELMSIVRRLIG